MACKDLRLLVGKGGVYGNVIRITPMLNVTEEEIDGSRQREAVSSLQ